MTERYLQVRVSVQIVSDKAGDRRVERSVFKRAKIQPSHLVQAGSDADIAGQSGDEEWIGHTAARKAVEAYRDLAADLGVRAGPGWKVRT